MTDVKPGQILAGKYRVERVLGTGGMGTVVAATHLQLEQKVAIKFLLPEALQNAEAVERFAREARAAVKIKGEHVARVTDVGTLETGAPYMVMEYLEGRDLSAVITERGALPVEEAADYILQICEALAEAHSLGIVHRDLKPANLFLSRRPDGTASIKVLDFGISKLTSGSASDHSVTKTSAIMGSPLYMSPEQMTAARTVDARSDIWSIGAILYELLAGQVPFDAETLPQICGLILSTSPRPLRDFRPEIPEQLQDIVLRCLAKNRDERYADVGELATALIKFGSRATSRSLERIRLILRAHNPDAPRVDAPVTSMPPPSGVGQATQGAWGTTQPPKRRAIPFVLGAALLIGAVGIGWALLLKPKANAEAPSVEPAAVLAAPGTSTEPRREPDELPEGSAEPAVEPAADVNEADAKPSSTAKVKAASATKTTPVTRKATPPARTSRPSSATVPTATKTVQKPKKKSAADLLGSRH